MRYECTGRINQVTRDGGKSEEVFVRRLYRSSEMNRLHRLGESRQLWSSGNGFSKCLLQFCSRRNAVTYFLSFDFTVQQLAALRRSEISWHFYNGLPADIPSRGAHRLRLRDARSLWNSGPSWAADLWQSLWISIVIIWYDAEPQFSLLLLLICWNPGIVRIFCVVNNST